MSKAWSATTLWLAVALLALSSVAQAAGKPASVRVARWQPHDFVFRCDAKVENPFAVPFAIEVSGPNGIRFTQPGFHDGDGVWKARVAPTAEGRWTLLTRSSLPALDKQSVEFDCGPDARPVATFTHHHGALRVDPRHPRHFAFDDGTPFFLMGYECDWLWALDMGRPELKTLEPFLDKLAGHGFNYVILNAYAHDSEDAIDHAAILQAMKDAGYSGYIDIEYESNKYPPDVANQKAIEFLNSTMITLK